VIIHRPHEMTKLKSGKVEKTKILPTKPNCCNSGGDFELRARERSSHPTGRR
jgi:hypothetical protein